MGLKINTTAIAAKTIASAAGPQYRPVMAMTIPKTKAAIVVPFRLPRPPTMTTAKLINKICHSRAGGNPEIGITKYMDSCSRRNNKRGLKDAAVMAYCFLF